MTSVTPTTLLTFAVVAALCVTYRLHKRRSVKRIKGPAAPFWTGNVRDFFYQKNVGDMDFRYMEEYGLVWRMGGPIGRDILLIADPKALQHIFHKSGYGYPKSIEGDVTTGILTGQSIFTASDGHSHSRHRKVMNPAFSAPQLRSFLPRFRNNAIKMCRMWKEQILDKEQSGSRVIPVNKWLARMTLDILGETAFQYDFGALDEASNALASTYDNMFSDSQLHPPLHLSILRETWWWMPKWMLYFMKYVPTRENKRLRQVWAAFEEVGNVLVDNATEEARSVELEKGKKDVMSVLVRANLSENPSLRLSKHEMVSEMSGLTIAGHETTANTITWLLWELAKLPSLQDQLRQEIKDKREQIAQKNGPGIDFSMEDLEGMPFLQALLKEVLRFHPIVYHLIRYSAKDDVLPLSEPITTITGEVIQEIPISKGQLIQLSICGYNRIKSIWGEDADKFNPMRFIDGKIENTVKVGMFGNLMSFSAGMRGCVGWRFALIEMQAVVVTLIENFEFSLPEDGTEVLRMPVALMSPMVEGRLDDGVRMPLMVRAITG